MAFVVVEELPLNEVVAIPAPPWQESEASHVEQCIKDLGVSFDPFLAG